MGGVSGSGAGCVANSAQLCAQRGHLMRSPCGGDFPAERVLLGERLRAFSDECVGASEVRQRRGSAVVEHEFCHVRFAAATEPGFLKRMLASTKK